MKVISVREARKLFIRGVKIGFCPYGKPLGVWTTYVQAETSLSRCHLRKTFEYLLYYNQECVFLALS